MVAGLAILAEWRQDKDLQAAIAALPDKLDAALECDWSEARDMVVNASSLYTLGRGPGFAVAQEAALTLKETSKMLPPPFATCHSRASQDSPS